MRATSAMLPPLGSSIRGGVGSVQHSRRETMALPPSHLQCPPPCRPTPRPPLQDSATLYALWPDGTCERMGLSGRANSSLTTMISAAVNASNSPAVAAAINARLANLSASLSAGSAGGQDQATQQVGHGHGGDVLMCRKQGMCDMVLRQGQGRGVCELSLALSLLFKEGGAGGRKVPLLWCGHMHTTLGGGWSLPEDGFRVC